MPYFSGQQSQVFALIVLVTSEIAVYSAAKVVSRTEELLKKCPHAMPESYTPLCPEARVDVSQRDRDYKCEVTNIILQLLPERFQSIDDRTETFVISSSLRVQWDVPCPNLDLKLKSTTYLNENMFWKPHINHKNAETDFGMTEGFTSRFYATVSEPGVATFLWLRSGVFTSTCDMDFTWFPFDDNECQVDFVSQTNVYAAVFIARTPSFQPNFMPHSVSWILESFNATAGIYNINGNRSVTSVKFQFRRRPEYFIFNLMLPIALLALLEIGSFFISPSATDRPIFACTILLAMSFLRGTVLDRVPPRPQRVFIADYTDYCTLLAWSCTAYALVACWLVRNQEKWFNHKSSILNASRSSIMDGCAGFLAAIAFLTINCYAFAVAVLFYYWDQHDCPD